MKKLMCSVALILSLAGCSSGSEPTQDAQAQTTEVSQVTEAAQVTQSSTEASQADEQRFPDIVNVAATKQADASWNFDVTVSSPYDTPERYADGWRVMSAEGSVFGEHMLGHDHASEQPYTRSQSGVVIPAEVTSVVVEGRDQANGYGGKTFVVMLEP